MVVFLEKAGATFGEGMSYIPLTISSPLCGAWATMRPRCMADRLASWALPEMHAGVPEMGAVDAWHAALTEFEDLKLEGTPFCGGAADIAKFFDQIIRDVAYTSAAYAGMPRNIFAAYKEYIENLKLYNCIAGGVGTPHRRRCGIPQGCLFSMMVVAHIMRPWVVLM